MTTSSTTTTTRSRHFPTSTPSSPAPPLASPPPLPKSATRVILAQAPSIRRGVSEPLRGPSERRLAALCDMDVSAFRERWTILNLLEEHPGRRRVLPHHSPLAGYKRHGGQGDVFPYDLARARAISLAVHDRFKKIVLLGLSVARAYLGAHGIKCTVELFTRVRITPTCEAIVFPHPSGVSHFWNDPKCRARARKAWKEFDGDDDSDADDSACDE